jgi:3D (Asp-Asp-Asp) domain-containing protein
MTPQRPPYIAYLLAALLTGLLLYPVIQQNKFQSLLADQKAISDKQTELIAVQEAYISDLEARLIQQFSKFVEVTAYCEAVNNTAIGGRATPGTCAVSDDLLPIFPFNSMVYVENVGVFRVNDVTNERITNTVDIFIGDCQEALIFGRFTAQATRIMQCTE